ncbi:DUF2510 domain-containing protein [Microbacterium sp. Mu-80]|uniref:DUF2510 domain-containing protein n=1 Tax=Microbacterium bandirmense TaxID=3122050 RepID=A0ABU8LCC0_9MICO
MSTPAGWYDDGSGRQRWWDGQQWTENFAPEGQNAADAATSEAGIPAFDPDATVLREDIATPASQDEQPTQAYPPSDVAAPGYAPPAAPGFADVNATAAYPGAYQAPGTGDQYGAYQGGGAYQGPGEPAGPKKKVSVIGWIAFGVALLGLLICWIPFVGLFLPVIGLVLSIIALFMKGAKWPGIVGLVASVIGLIVSVLIVIGIFALAQQASEYSSYPSSTSDTVEPDETDSDEPTDASGEGRPSADEVATGFEEIIATMGMTDELTDEQITCYADYFVASDIPDETLWVIASGDETLSDVDAATEFTEKLTDGMSTCLIP